MKPNKLASATLVAFAILAPLAAALQGREIFGADSSQAVLKPNSSPMTGWNWLSESGPWINSAPLKAADLNGKVVLVEFWTYSCINWRRQLPYVRTWADRYRDQGLVVIGVHTPEFAFERDPANVRDAVREMNIPYPVAIDSDYRIWNAFGNAYRPALYFIDGKGRVRHQAFGEGGYASSEKVLQQLLTEAGATGVSGGLSSVQGRGLEAPADLSALKTPETYVGYERTEGFASRGVRDKPWLYAIDAPLKLNQWGLSGSWTMEAHRIMSTSAGARISYRFHARDLHLVMGSPGTPIHFRVLLDGGPPGHDHGTDIDDQGYGVLDKPALYQLIRQPGGVTDRLFEIEYLDPGAEAYAFTFG